jgi:tRNA splicing ligase
MQLFYGENMYGIHSIEYNGLTDYFYLFHIYDHRSAFLPWDDVTLIAKDYRFTTVPVRWRGTLKYPTELHLKLTKLMEEGSALGDTVEGFVVRPTRGFGYGQGVCRLIAKYVRADHVQSDKHWIRNWQKAKLL